MNEEVRIKGQRETIIKEWNASGRQFLTTYKAYKSTQQVVFSVLNALPTGGAPTMAFAVARAGQTLEWFSYGIGENIPYGPAPVTKRATDADTNLTSPNKTNGQEDFVIEGASLTTQATRLSYPNINFDPSVTDPDVRGSLTGAVPVMDPAALIAPPQVNSPFNLENALMGALLPHMTFEFEFDRRRREQIGTLDQVPEGGAKSFLRANGDPRTDNRIRFPEGYLWRAVGKQDSDLVVRSYLRSPVVIPISLIDVDADQTVGNAVPDFLYLDLSFRVHGLSCGPVSRN